MKAVLISIKPKWCDLIFSGEKKDEIRKTKPKFGNIDVYVYQTGNGGVIGKFRLWELTYIQAWIDKDGEKHLGNTLFLKSCLSFNELFDYIHREQKPGKPYPGGWAWRVDNPILFEQPKPLSDFGLKRPPQSWCYVDVT